MDNTSKETTKTTPSFPTEIVTLPSEGFFYPEDNPLSSGKVEIKYIYFYLFIIDITNVKTNISVIIKYVVGHRGKWIWVSINLIRVMI